MNDADALSYVQASARALQLPLDAQQAQRVATHLQRTAAMAQLLECLPLTEFDEPADVYCPARPAPGQD